MWFRAFAVFLLFSKVQSQQQCSDSLGTCSGSRASLMQVKSLSQKLQASTGRGASTRAQTLAGFQKYTQELVDQYLDDPEATAGNVSAEVKQAIDVILSYLDKLYEDLIYFHGQDVKDAQYCANLPERCKEAHFNTSVVATIHGNQEQVRGHREIHAKCRQDLMAICSSPSCPEYHDYRILGRDNGEDRYGVQFLPGCAKHGHLAHQAAATNSDDLTEFEDCLQPTQNWLDPLYGHYINCRCPNSQEGETCKQAEPPSEDKSRTCAENQETYELANSLMNREIRLHCGNYDNCIEHGRKQCEGDDADGISACTRISANSQARQTDNETAERIHCLLNVLVTPADDRAALLLACHEIDYSDMNAFWQIPCAVDGGVAHDLCPGETGDQCIPITEGYRVENGLILRTDDDACFNDGSYYDPCNNGEHEADITGVWQDPARSFYNGAIIRISADSWHPEVSADSVWSTSSFELQHTRENWDMVEVKAAGETYHHEALLGSDGLLWIRIGQRQWKLAKLPEAGGGYVDGATITKADYSGFADSESEAQAACNGRTDCKGYWEVSHGKFAILVPGTRTWAAGLPNDSVIKVYARLGHTTEAM